MSSPFSTPTPIIRQDLLGKNVTNYKVAPVAIVDGGAFTIPAAGVVDMAGVPAIGSLAGMGTRFGGVTVNLTNVGEQIMGTNQGFDSEATTYSSMRCTLREIRQVFATAQLEYIFYTQAYFWLMYVMSDPILVSGSSFQQCFAGIFRVASLEEEIVEGKNLTVVEGGPCGLAPYAGVLSGLPAYLTPA